MRTLQKSAMGLILSAGLAVGTAASLQAAEGAAWFQEYPSRYMDMRGLVDRAQSDLRDAAELEHGNNKQRDRYHDAQEHLSNFDRDLTRGRFNKGELERSIDTIQGILKHNILQARSRDALMRDASDLRVARARRW
jgi:hypothetical protein